MIEWKHVPVKSKSIQSYRKFFTASDKRLFRQLTRLLKGKRVLHVNATPRGGGVAEILSSLIPLQQSLGLKSSWYAMPAPKKFFVITKEIHNALQGKKFSLSKNELTYYESVNHKLAKSLERKRADIIVVHDPQPLPLIAFMHHVPMISRMHIDCAYADSHLLKYVQQFLKQYDHAIVSRKDCLLQADIASTVMQPAIDPLAEKNKQLPYKKARQILEKQLSIPHDKPLIVQVSRFDPWKNPIGVIQAIKQVKRSIPDVELLLLGIQEAQDDPEAAHMLKQVKQAARDLTGIHIIHSLNQIGSLTNDACVRAAQSGADVVVQFSIREGFGLTVTEAMWKERVVIGGPGAGIQLQIQDGKQGYVVKSERALANRIKQLLLDSKKCKIIGRAAKRSVRGQYLMPRLLMDHCLLYKTILDL